jgi:type I restriction enzyme S subunit
VRPNQRHFGIIKTQPENFLVSTGFAVIDVDDGMLVADYLYYLLTRPTLVEALHAIAEQSTSAYPSIKPSDIEELEIEIPELATQKKIADILGCLDKKIKQNTEINENLTEQARAVFQAWFIDYEPFGGEPPSDWRPSTLGQIAEMKTDSWSPAKNPDVVVEHYSIPAFDEQHYPVFEIASGIKSNKYILNSNSVMISKLNPDTKRIWRPMCLSAHPVCSTEFIVYEAKKQEQRDYIYSILDSVPFLNHLCSHTTGSTNSRQRATPKSTLDFTLCLPPDSVIEDFCQIVTPMYDLIASNIVENQSLAKARDSLLPRLMSGELDVSGLAI